MKEFRLLRADEIECRISICNAYGVGLLLYKDARCDQNILDEIVGPLNWQRHHSRDNANCIVSIWDEDKKQWIQKEDTGKESFTEAEKGLASDSFKRACFNWGIGRELYTAPNMFVNKKDLDKHEEKNGRWTCSDSFVVTNIEYIDRKIVYVKIANRKSGKEIEFGTPAKIAQEQEQIANQLIGAAKVAVLRNKCSELGVDENKVCGRYGKNSLEDMTEADFVKAIQGLNATKKE